MTEHCTNSSLILRKQIDDNQVNQSEFIAKKNPGENVSSRSFKYGQALKQLKLLKENTKNQAGIASLTRSIIDASQSSDLLPVMLNKCAQALVDDLDAAFARIWTFDAKENMLVLQASAGLYTHLNGGHARIPLGSFKIGRIAADHKPHLTNSVQTDSWVSDTEWAKEEGIVSFAGYPLLVRDNLYGVVGVFSRHPMSDVTLAGLGAVSAIIANGIKRKEAEVEKRVQDRFTKILFEASVDALFALNREGIFTDVNPAGEKLLGVPRNELIGKCFTEFAIDPERELNAFQEVLTLGFIIDFVSHLKTKYGNIIDCSVNASAYPNPEGKIEGVIASLRDVTEKIKYKEQLQNLASIIEHSTDAIVSKDLDGIVTSWNNGAERIYGYRPDEILGKPITLLIPSDRLNEYHELMNNFKKGTHTDYLEAKCLTKSGETIDVSLSFSPIKDISGNLIGISTISRNISERKVLERTLEFNETLFREICAGALDGIICVDNTGKATVWNRSAEKIFGYQADEVIGKNIHEVLAPETLKDKCAEALKEFSETGRGPIIGKTVELEALRADGSAVSIELAVSSFKLSDKWNAIGIVRDITERKQAQLQLHSKTKKLQTNASQMELLTQLGEYLQVCVTDEEAFEVVAKFSAKLFPESSGELSILKDSKNWLMTQARWGRQIADTVGFPVNDCWSIRRGQAHFYDSNKPGPRCHHVDSEVVSCLCVPLVLSGVIYGIMHVQWSSPIDEDIQKLVTRLAGDSALALANLKLRKQLQEMSVHDALTGLFNRRYMEEFFNKGLISSRRTSSPFSVLMLDIDHFKNFNDTFGHEAGDAVLAELGHFFKREIRGSDVVCRYGGEEFIILLPGASVENAEKRAELLRKNVQLLEVKCNNQTLPAINLSIGVSSYPNHGDSADELVRAADAALYKAKAEGRDRVTVAVRNSSLF